MNDGQLQGSCRAAAETSKIAPCGCSCRARGEDCRLSSSMVAMIMPVVVRPRPICAKDSRTQRVDWACLPVTGGVWRLQR